MKGKENRNRMMFYKFWVKQKKHLRRREGKKLQQKIL